MNVIYKYPVAPKFELELPPDAFVLTVMVQNGIPAMWILLDPEAPKVTRKFVTLATGEPTETEQKHLWYIGTFQSSYGVFHLFEKGD